MTMTHEEYAARFAGLKDLLWFNHAGVSPISQDVAQAMYGFLEEMQTEGAIHIPAWYGRTHDIKAKAGSLLGADPNYLSLTPNTTHGINLIANGLKWKEGDEVLLCNQEYPANVYPWWGQQGKGVRLRWVHPLPEGRLPVELYEEKITPRTRVLAVSHVQFSSGYRQDLRALGELCSRKGIWLVVDAIQSFAVFPIEVESWRIHALTTGAHKWLLGPTGIAVFYCCAELMNELELTWVGADSMVDAFNYLDYRYELLPDGRRFENAMLNFAGIAGLEAALDLVLEYGREQIEKRIHSHTDALVQLLESLGFVIHSQRGEDTWSGIVSVTHPQIAARHLDRALRKERIITSVRDDRWRLSPHAYMADSALDRIAKVLEEILPLLKAEVNG